MSAPLNVLLVEDAPGDPRVRDELAGDMAVTLAAGLEAARRQLEAGRTDCVLLDVSLPGPSGLQGLATLRDARPDVPVVVLGGTADDARAAGAVRAGAQDFLVKGETPAPVLARAVRHAVERKQSERRLAELATRDALTGLPDRSRLHDRARAALERMRRDPAAGPVGLLCVGLDRFRAVNDSLGHAAGDELLVGIAQRLRDCARPGDTVARLGGDEFAVLCDGLGDPEELDGLAGRVSAALAEPLDIGGVEIYPSASIGVAVATGDHATERLLGEADAAMRGAKATGRPIARFDASSTEEVGHALRAEAELQRALRRGELALHYQPLVRLGGEGGVSAVEALVRWQHPDRGLVGPEEFLGTAEDTWLIRRLGAWVLDEACRQLAAWDAAGLAHGVTLAVNLSPRQLDDEALVPMVTAALREHGLEASRLCLELTESALLDEGAGVPARLRALKDLGVRLAIDARLALAWSTGAATPGLGTAPVDVVKLDRRFVARMDVEPQARRIVTAVLGLAGSMGVQTVAEGIENAERARELAELGCELGQGHAFTPASPPAVVEALLVPVKPAPPDRIKVFLCDDAPALRHLLREFLEWGGDVEIVGESEDGEGLTAAVREAGPDVVLLDLSMPRVDGLEALAELRAAEPELGIVILSGFEQERMGPRALALGADRYLEKAAGMQEVRAAVRGVAAARRGTPAFVEDSP